MVVKPAGAGDSGKSPGSYPLPLPNRGSYFTPPTLRRFALPDLIGTTFAAFALPDAVERGAHEVHGLAPGVEALRAVVDVRGRAEPGRLVRGDVPERLLRQVDGDPQLAGPRPPRPSEVMHRDLGRQREARRRRRMVPAPLRCGLEPVQRVRERLRFKARRLLPWTAATSPPRARRRPPSAVA